MEEDLIEKPLEDIVAGLEEELRTRDEMIKALVAAREEPYVPQPKGPRIVVDNVVDFPAGYDDAEDMDAFWAEARKRCSGHVVIVGVNPGNLYIGSSVGYAPTTHYILSSAAHVILGQAHEDGH